MNSLKASEQQWLQSVRQQLEPSASDAARVLRNLEARVALGVLGDTASTELSASGDNQVNISRSVSGRARFAIKPVVLAKARAVIASGVVGFVSGYFTATHVGGPNDSAQSQVESAEAPATLAQPGARTTESQQATIPSESTAAELSAPSLPPERLPPERLPPEQLSPEQHPLPRPTTLASPTVLESQRAAPTDSRTLLDADPFSEELRLLERAERAIRNGEPALALGLLDALNARFPVGKLGEERQAARLMARCQRETDSERRGAAREFLKGHPRSLYRSRLQALCELD